MKSSLHSLTICSQSASAADSQFSAGAANSGTQLNSNSKIRESELLYGWWFTTNQFVLGTNPLRLTTTNIFQLNTCGNSPHVTSSLTIGWVCHLQLLLALASAVILRSESRGAHDHILLSQIRESSNLEGPVHVFISPRNRVAQLYTRY
jgi:hypothetical protein